MTLSGIGSAQYQQAYNVAPGAQIYYGSAPASLANFHVGDAVMLTLDQSGDANVITDLAGQSTPIQVAHAGSLTGTVKLANPNQIVVHLGSGTGFAALFSGLSGNAITIQIPKLPAGLVVRSVSVTSQGIVATASASNTTLTQ